MLHFGRALAVEQPVSPDRRPCLVLTKGPVVVDRFEVPDGVSYVGRLPDAALVLHSELVSRMHAVVRRQGDRVTVEDLDSRNGTWIGPTRVHGESEIHPGDVLRFADVSLTYSLVATDREAPDPRGLRRWWRELTRRGKTAVLTAGALAGAVTAIWGLGQLIWGPDAENVAKVNAVQVLETRMPLSRYQVKPPIIMAADAAGVSDGQLRLLVNTVTASADKSEGTVASAETSESTESPTPPPSPTGSTSPSETVSPSVDPSPSGSTSSSAPPSPSVDVFESVEGMAPLEEAVDEEFSFTVKPVTDHPEAPGAVAVPPETAMAAAAVNAAPPSGVAADPQAAARRVVRLLRQVRTRPITTKDGVRKDPVGVLVDVDLELSGLRNETVSLRWQVRRVGKAKPLYGAWMRQVEAYRLTPESEHISVTVPDMWVPMPKRPGNYVVRVQVNLGDQPLGHARSEPFS